MSNEGISILDWLDAADHCNEVKFSLISKIGVPGKAVSIKMAALHATLISYNTGLRTKDLYDGMLSLEG